VAKQMEPISHVLDLIAIFASSEIDRAGDVVIQQAQLLTAVARLSNQTHTHACCDLLCVMYYMDHVLVA